MNPFHLALAGAPEPAGACWPGFAPAGEALFFASPKKSTQKKSEPTVCVPKQSFGQPTVLASGGRALELASLKQSRTLIPQKLCSSVQTEGPVTAQSARLVALRATLPSCAFVEEMLVNHFVRLRPHTEPGHSLCGDKGRCLKTARAEWGSDPNSGRGRRKEQKRFTDLAKPQVQGSDPYSAALSTTPQARAKRSAAALPPVEAGLSSAAGCGKRAGDCLSEASSSQRVIGVRHQFRCDALRRTLRASRQARRIWALTPKTRHRAAARTSARLFFGYFHLAKQKKVARPPGRDPASGSKPTGQSQQNHTPCRHAACVQ